MNKIKMLLNHFQHTDVTDAKTYYQRIRKMVDKIAKSRRISAAEQYQSYRQLYESIDNKAVAKPLAKAMSKADQRLNIHWNAPEPYQLKKNWVLPLNQSTVNQWLSEMWIALN